MRWMLVLLLAFSCASAGSGYGHTYTLEIENQNWYDIRVYAVDEGRRRHRVATVTSMRSEYVYPRWAPRDLQFDITLIGNARVAYRTPVLHSPGPGGHVRLTVRNNLALSTLVPVY